MGTPCGQQGQEKKITKNQTKSLSHFLETSLCFYVLAFELSDEQNQKNIFLLVLPILRI